MQTAISVLPVTNLAARVQATIDEARALSKAARLAEYAARSKRNGELTECDVVLNGILDELNSVFVRAASCPYFRLVQETDRSPGSIAYDDPYIPGVQRLKLRITKTADVFLYRLDAVPTEAFEFEGETGRDGECRIETADAEHFKTRLVEFLGNFLAHHEPEVEA